MSNLYNLTKELHEVIKKHKIKIENDFAWFSKDNQYKIHYKQYGLLVIANQDNVKLECLAIQGQQIRQILLAFFKNPGFKNLAEELEKKWLSFRIDFVNGQYITPLFDQEPEKVLTELLEILKSINIKRT